MPVSLLKRFGIVTLKTYRQIFWIGYIMVMIVALIPFKNDLHDKTISVITFNFHLDQILHTVVYLFICIFFLLGDLSEFYLFENQNFLKFLFSVLFLALATEAVQIFIPSRVFNLYDLLANMAGIFPGIILIKSFKRSRDNTTQEG